MVKLMTRRTIFMSHIHEERDLALILKEALETEFGGFVDIFVSSDGISIPAGSNFLERIEEALLISNAAFFLISPYSVNRNWINFELGSLWIRNKINKLNKEPELVIVPLCHSGMDLAKLPQPINNLNAIQGNAASSLQFAFKSIQTAVGGKGELRTNFSELVERISRFESEYTIGTHLEKFFKYCTNDIAKLYSQAIEPYTNYDKVIIGFGEVEKEKLSMVKELAKPLSKFIELQIKPSRHVISPDFMGELYNLDILVDVGVMLRFQELLEK